MKKFLKDAAVLAAMVLALAFVGCKEEDDDNNIPPAQEIVVTGEFSDVANLDDLDNLVGTWLTFFNIEETDTEKWCKADNSLCDVTMKTISSGNTEWTVSKDGEAIKIQQTIKRGAKIEMEATPAKGVTLTKADADYMINELKEDMGITFIWNGTKFRGSNIYTKDTPIEGVMVAKIEEGKCFVYEIYEDNNGTEYEYKLFSITMNEDKDGIRIYEYDKDTDKLSDDPVYVAKKR